VVKLERGTAMEMKAMTAMAVVEVTPVVVVNKSQSAGKRNLRASSLRIACNFLCYDVTLSVLNVR
jgi:hypothetical protein